MKREIPKKNYFFVGLISLAVIVIVLYLAKLYTANNINRESSIMSDYLSNVTIEELNNYLLENPDVVIYWDNKSNVENKGFEKKLKKYIIKNDLQRKFVFVDTTEITNSELKSVADKYLDKSLKDKRVSLKIMPNLLIVVDGKIIDVLYTFDQEMDMDYLKEKFEKYEVVE